MRNRWVARGNQGTATSSREKDMGVQKKNQEMSIRVSNNSESDRGSEVHVGGQ